MDGPVIEQSRSAFDERYGTDTDGKIAIGDLTVDSPNARYGSRYQPTAPDVLISAVESLGEDPEGFTFIDLGCGKGRTLIVASELGFKDSVGVEFVQELATTARANIEKLGITNASVWLGDAADYKFPSGNLVIFIYNSFSAEVFGPVLEHLKESHPDKLYVIYKNPRHADVLNESGFLTSLGSQPGRDPLEIWRATWNAPASGRIRLLGPPDATLSAAKLSWAPEDNLITAELARAPIRCFSLIDVDHVCGPRCAERLDQWLGYYGNQDDKRLAVSEAKIRVGGTTHAIHVHATPLAIIDLSGDIAAYESSIGSRNRIKIRKARSLGFDIRKTDGNAFLDAIFEIRSSTPVRQGRPLPEDYFKRPSNSAESDGFCPRHEEVFYGAFKDERLAAYCTVRFFGEVASVEELIGHKDFLDNNGMMNLLVREVVNDIVTAKPWVRGLNFLHAIGWEGLIYFKNQVGFMPRRTVITRAPPEIAQRVEVALANPEEPVPDTVSAAAPAPATATDGLGEFLFSGSVTPPEASLGPSGFHSLVSGLGLPATAEVLCFGGGSWIPNGAVAALVDAGIRPHVVEWRRAEFALALLEKFGPAIELTTAPPGNVDFKAKFDVVVFDLFSNEFMDVLADELPKALALLGPEGMAITRFVYDLNEGADADNRQALEERYLQRFGRADPGIEDIDNAFANGPYKVVGLVDRLNGRSSTRGEGWLILKRRSEGAPARGLAAPAGLLATRRTESVSRTYSTPMDPETGFSRAIVTITVPSVPQVAVDSRFAFHEVAKDGVGGQRVFAVQKGGVLVSEDLGATWDYVATPETGDINIWHAFPLASGNVLLQGSSPHAPEDPRGHPDLEAPVFVCDRNLKVLHRAQPGKSHWHGTRSIDEAGGTIIYAEYPTNAVKYRSDFAQRQAELSQFCEDPAVFRSTDGGQTWTKVFEQTWRDIRHFHTALADPYSPGTWYVSSGDQPHECRMWRSVDDGLTWSEMTATGEDIDLHSSLAGQHQSINRHTDMVVLPDQLIWGSDDLLGRVSAYLDPAATMSSRVGSRLFISPKTTPLKPKCVAFVGSHVRSLVDVGAGGYVVLTEAKRVEAVPRPQVCLLSKNEPHRLTQLFTVDRYQAGGTGFTFSRNSRAAVNGRFFTYRDRNDAFAGGPRLLQWDISFEEAPATAGRTGPLANLP